MADNAQLIHDVTCIFDNGKFILDDLPSPLPEVFTVRFTTPEVFTQGNMIVADGREMYLRTPGGINASSAFFRAGTVFHCDIDFGKGYAYGWYNTANLNHAILNNRDVATSHPSAAIDHRGEAVDAVLDGLESKAAAIIAGGAELAVRVDNVEQALADLDHPVMSVNGQTGAVTVDLPDFPAVQTAITNLEQSVADFDAPVTSVNGKTGDVTVDLPDFSAVEAELNNKADLSLLANYVSMSVLADYAKIPEMTFHGECSHSGSTFTLIVPSMPAQVPELFSVRFRAPANFYAANAIRLGSVNYSLRTYDMGAAADAAFAANAVVVLHFDRERGNCFIGQPGGSSSGGGWTPPEWPMPGHSEAILVYDAGQGTKIIFTGLNKSTASDDLEIAMGDGTVISHEHLPATGNFLHTYKAGNVYNVTLSGTRATYNLRANKGVLAVFGTLPGMTTCETLFQSCTNLTHVSEELFDNCGGVSNFSHLFNGCTSLFTVPAFKKCPSAIEFPYAFQNTTALRALPSGFLRGSTMRLNLGHAFYNSGLFGLDEDIFSEALGFLDLTNAFRGCADISTNVPRLWEHPGRPTTASHFRNCFTGCINAANYSDIPADWQ